MNRKFTRQGFFLTCIFGSLFATEASAQKLDTLKRKDADGWEFLQIRSYGTTIEEGNLHNGVAEGVWTVFWPGSFPREITTYVHGKKDGAHMNVTPKGQIELVEQYKNDQLEGPRRVYNDNGYVLEDAMYSEGKKHGYFNRWYANTKRQESSNYTYDKRDGRSSWYFEDGSKAAEYNYVNGDIDGDVATYYPGGKLAESGPYKKGTQSGTWKEYYEDGTLKAEGPYKNGEKDGQWKEYDTKGKYTKTVKYVKGEIKK